MDWEDKLVKCPFYLERQKDKFRIKCEGVVNNSTTQITFRGGKKSYLKEFCCDNYQNCRVYKMLCGKYANI